MHFAMKDETPLQTVSMTMFYKSGMFVRFLWDFRINLGII